MQDSGATSREFGNLYPLAKKVMLPTFRFLWRIHVSGQEHLPDGAAIFCPNHTSVIDSFFLPVALPRRITFVGKAEYLDDWKTKHLFPALGMIPIDRGGGSASQRALDTAAGVLEQGEYFGIYPEGTRARDGLLHKGHTGPARLALRTGAPIVPVGIRGTRTIQSPEAKFPTPFRTAEINFGRPIRVERYRGREDDHLVYRQIIDEVMFEIRELSGQDYVDSYATKKAESLPSEVSRVESIVTNGHPPSGPPPTAARPYSGTSSSSTVRRTSADVLAPRAIS